MKKTLKMTLIAGAVCAAGFATMAPASAHPTGFSFRVGDVAIAYQDGYYDHRNRWHSWRHAREHDWYRANYRARYYDRGRSYYGWRDSDRDGVPNRYDRDRDNDGTPNRFDRRPNNPYRD